MKRMILTLILFYSANCINAQFVFKDPPLQKGKWWATQELQVKDVTLYPDRIDFHMFYGKNKYSYRRCFIDNSMLINFDGTLTTYTISSVSGDANFGDNYFKPGKYEFTLSFKVDWQDLIDDILFPGPPLDIRLISTHESESSFTWQEDWKYWRLDHIKLPMTAAQLYYFSAYSYFTKLAVKDEFETTEQYKKRTEAAALKQKILEHISNLKVGFSVGNISFGSPSLNYDADQQTFTLQYPGAKPVKIKVPLAQAPAVKESIMEKDWKVVDAEVHDLSDGGHFIKSITFKDNESGKIYEFQNEIKPEASQSEDAVTITIFNQLIKAHPNGKLLIEK